MASRLTFRVHATQRMFERGISVEDVRAALANGEVIIRYDDDTPYPSRLVLGWRNAGPLHIVAADNTADDETIIITACK